MKRFVMGMVVALIATVGFTACSSDEEEEVLQLSELSGIWKMVHDEGVADAGLVTYTFCPNEGTMSKGTVVIYTSDWAAGDNIVYHDYMITPSGHLRITPKVGGQETRNIDCQIRSLDSTQMVWVFTSTDKTQETIVRFKKEVSEWYCGNE